MANTVSNIAVISFPRSGSKTIVRNISEELNKQPALGVLHTPEHLKTQSFNIITENYSLLLATKTINKVNNFRNIFFR